MKFIIPFFTLFFAFIFGFGTIAKASDYLQIDQSTANTSQTSGGIPMAQTFTTNGSWYVTAFAIADYGNQVGTTSLMGGIRNNLIEPCITDWAQIQTTSANGIDWITASTTGWQLQASTTYYLFVILDSGSGSTYAVSNANPYSGGQRYSYSGTAYASDDLAFKIYTSVPPTEIIEEDTCNVTVDVSGGSSASTTYFQKDFPVNNDLSSVTVKREVYTDENELPTEIQLEQYHIPLIPTLIIIIVTVIIFTNIIFAVLRSIKKHDGR